MTAEPDTPGPDTGGYEVIHLGGQAAVVVLVTDFLRLRALDQAATPAELEDAEDAAAVPGVEGLGRGGPDDVRVRRRSTTSARHASKLGITGRIQPRDLMDQADGRRIRSTPAGSMAHRVG